jgi:tripartite-type tricarboxylate transporter receptor subunit TctC
MRPVHIISGFTLGSGGDIIACFVGQWISNHLGAPFVIVNQPGAGADIAATTGEFAPGYEATT